MARPEAKDKTECFTVQLPHAYYGEHVFMPDPVLQVCAGPGQPEV